MKRAVHAGIISILAILFFDGCALVTITQPSESATEQLLLSSSVDRALASTDFSIFANRKVYLDDSYIKGNYHYEYAVGEIRDALSRAGALLVQNRTNSDVIIEARAGAISVDDTSTLIGIPHTPTTVPLAGSINLPELAIYKSVYQDSYAKIALLAYANRSREHIFSTGPLLGKSYDHYHKILFISWDFTNIPAKQHGAKQRKKYQKWFPQYDLANMPPETSITNSPSPNGK